MDADPAGRFAAAEVRSDFHEGIERIFDFDQRQIRCDHLCPGSEMRSDQGRRSRAGTKRSSDTVIRDECDVARPGDLDRACIGDRNRSVADDSTVDDGCDLFERGRCHQHSSVNSLQGHLLTPHLHIGYFGRDSVT